MPSYRALFERPGNLGFAVAGLIGRFPVSMLGLGAVVMVTGSGGSYGMAGVVTAVLSLAQAAVGPAVGRAADRLGQHRILVPTAVAHLVGVGGLVGVAVLGAPDWLYLPTSVVAGASVPQITAMVRTRWADRLDGASLSTAFSLESVLDEVVFIIGPVLATVLGTAVWAPAGVAAAGALAVTGAVLLAAQRGSEPTRQPDPGAGDAHRMSSSRTPSAITVPGVRVLMVSAICLGALFGAVDVAMVAFAQDHGHRSLSGVLLALMALGSLVSGVLYGTRRWIWSLRRRFLLAAVLLVAAYSVVASVTSLAVMAGVIAVAGFTIAPAAIAETSLIEGLVPARALTEGFSWINTAAAGGTAAGSALTGVVVTQSSGHRGLLVAVVSGVLALVAVALGAGALELPEGRPGT